jgi:hypothetical protein
MGAKNSKLQDPPPPPVSQAQQNPVTPASAVEAITRPVENVRAVRGREKRTMLKNAAAALENVSDQPQQQPQLALPPLVRPPESAQPQAPPPQLQQEDRDIGQTSFGISTDNNFKFVLDNNLNHDEDYVDFEDIEEPQNLPTVKKPITKFNFFLVRHAKSCANETESNIKKLNLDDPFISNDGIWATDSIKKEYDELFRNKNIDHYFCSVLIRTWCTAWMLFRKYISDFQIAPHLRESSTGYTNQPYPYATNVKRFAFFKKYVEILTTNDEGTDGQPGYALMNKTFANYGSEFVKEIGIANFMKWYITNENELGRNNKSIRNVVVVCHSDLIMTFCEDHLSKSELAKRHMGKEGETVNGKDKGFFKNYHNYCVKVQVRMTENLPVPAAMVAGNKNKKIRKMKTKKKLTKLNKHKLKKTRIRKTRGGGIGKLFSGPNQFIFNDSLSGENGNSSDVTNLPLQMTIKTIIKGTKDIPRYKNLSTLTTDCICDPNAYINKEATLECATKNRENDNDHFFNIRHLPKEN